MYVNLAFGTRKLIGGIVRNGKPEQDNIDPSRNYYFRANTVLDENGNVKSALYGKIYGDFMQFRYYLNPTPNDRNVEFVPKRNLLKELRQKPTKEGTAYDRN
ncbi:MAG: hypothetical protein KIS67_01275 [Verrucomicrobiae bacterium]|nr:hypothetical protein [Verrucomicrobiae bacterium]